MGVGRFTCAAALAFSLHASAAQLELPRPSQTATVSQTVGYTTITVTYGRPSVRGRKIWGDLIAYDQVWRTGANEATTIHLTEDVTVEGKKLAAGKYSIHTIPSRSEWTVIFNRAAGSRSGGSRKMFANSACWMTMLLSFDPDPTCSCKPSFGFVQVFPSCDSA